MTSPSVTTNAHRVTKTEVGRKRSFSAQPEELRVVLYSRVSTREQADSGAGLAAQSATLCDAARMRQWNTVATIVDAGHSAATLDRPGIRRALDMLAAGEADALAVAKLDRLSRSMLDFATLLERSRAEGWSLIALDLGVDTSTAAGELLANVLLAFAQFERRLIAERTRDGLAAKRAAGVRLGRPSALSTHVLARILGERRRGTSYRAIAQGLTEAGVPTPRGGPAWQASTIRDVLNRHRGEHQ